MNNNMQDILKNYYANGGKTLFEGWETPYVVDASDIFSRYRLTPKQKDDWNNMEAQVLSNMGMYGITSPQTLGLVQKEIAKLNINLTIDAIMPSDFTPGGLAYSTPIEKGDSPYQWI